MSGKINIKSRAFRLILIGGSMLRIKHFRGHGIHSPFVYSLIRQVFMKHKIRGSEHDTYNDLRRKGIRRHWAVQLQNLKTLRPDFKILFDTPSAPIELDSIGDHTILCLIHPRHNRQRLRKCTEKIRTHNGISIDNRGYILIIYDQRFLKQHFKL